MPKIERNGTCETCQGGIRYYPSIGESPSPVAGNWSHLDRKDWINNPHPVKPTDESLRAAGLIE